MATISVYLVVFSLSLVYVNGQRRPSDWGSTRFGQGNFGDDRGRGRDMFGGFRPNQMGPDFGQGGQGGMDRDLFGSRDFNEMGQGGGVGQGQPRGPEQGDIPNSVQPPAGLNPLGQNPGIGPGQTLLSEEQDQIAQEQAMGQPGQLQPPARQLPASPGPGQFLGLGQGEVPTSPQPPVIQTPRELGQELPSQPPIPTQGQPPMRQRPVPEQNGGIGRGQLERGEIPMPQRPPLNRNPSQIGQGEQTTLRRPAQNDLPLARPPTANPNSTQLGRPQTPPPSVAPGQARPSQRRSEFGDGDIDEPLGRVSRLPRGK